MHSTAELAPLGLLVLPERALVPIDVDAEVLTFSRDRHKLG